MEDKYVFSVPIPIKTKFCPFHDRSRPMQLFCDQAAVWLPTGLVPYLGLNMTL